MPQQEMTERQEIDAQFESLRRVRQPRMQRFEDITRYIVPYCGRYPGSGRDRDRDPGSEIIDDTATLELETLVSGMMAMRTSPARPWFRFQSRDPALNKRHSCRAWFHVAQQIHRDVFARSNTNLMLPHAYRETGAFGIGAAITVEDFDTVIHHHLLTAGEYMVATDGRGHVNRLYREFEMTVAEVVGEFGLQNCSDTVKTAWRGDRFHDPVKVRHVIEPRRQRNPRLPNAANMPWKSCCFEVDSKDHEYLRISGHRQFPCLVPRWDVLGNDTWGHGPGDRALGNVVQLQFMQERINDGADYQSRPPVQAPTSMIGRDRDLLPGGISYVDQNSPHGGIRTAYEVPVRLDVMNGLVQDCRDRIARTFHSDLFLVLSRLDNATQRTAAEIFQRKDETLTMLGPVTQRLQNELDRPLIDITFSRLIETGVLPPPPPELVGQELEVEYIGPLAQALKSVAAQSVDRFTSALGQIATVKPDVLDKFDADAWVDIYSDLWGVDPDLIVPGQRVALIRKARNDALAAKEQAEMMQVQARTARDLAGAPTVGRNALTDAAAAAGGGAVDPLRGYAVA